LGGIVEMSQAWLDQREARCDLLAALVGAPKRLAGLLGRLGVIEERVGAGAGVGIVRVELEGLSVEAGGVGGSAEALAIEIAEAHQVMRNVAALAGDGPVEQRGELFVALGLGEERVERVQHLAALAEAVADLRPASDRAVAVAELLVLEA